MDNNFKVYKYTNPENNKVYIGLTKNTPKERAHTNQGNGYTTCIHFYNAIKKHKGLDFFKLEILKEGLTAEEANYWEDYYIRYYDAKNPQKGYNINDGGGAMSQKQREKISQLDKEKWANGDYDSLKVPVYCIELEKEFESISEAARQLEKYHVSRTALIDTCNYKNKFCGHIGTRALHWCYLKDKSDELIRELKDRPEKGLVLPVYCIELDQTFESASAAKRATGIDCTQISKNARGITKSAGKHPETGVKLHWQFVEN